MKKSQILAALALAFALGLGVVAPSANTYATIIGTQPEATNASKAIDDAITAAYNVGGTVDINGTETLVYSLYNDVITDVNSAEAAVKAAEDGAATALKTLLANTDGNLHTAVSVSSLRNATYEQVVAFIRNYINGDLTDAVKKGEAAGATADEVTAGTNAAADISTLNGNLANQKATVEAVYATQAQNILDELQDLTDVDAITTKDGKYDLAAYNKVVATAKALPKYTQYKNLVDKINAAYALSHGNASATVDEANAAVEAIKAAVAAINGTDPGTQQPTDPSNPSDDDNKGDDDNKTPTTPGTGIVSTAEGSASTTISIVAGLATALTALGAGVVAYRNARRSGEK